MPLSSTETWSAETFGRCQLGDSRRTQRLVKLASCLSGNIGQSIVKSSVSEANIEGAYRLLRNEHVDPEAIATGGYEATLEQCQESDVLLAVEDTTTLSFHHGAREELGDLGGKETSVNKGFFVHSVLLLDGQSERTLGLIEQSRWKREFDKRGQRHQRRSRPYESKESVKWETASRRVAARLGRQMEQVISVCDRESDIYEYLHYKLREQQRFVTRANWNRRVTDGPHSLYAQAAALPETGTYDLHIMQRGGRKGRQVKMRLKGGSVTLRPPSNRQTAAMPLTLNLVVCEDVGGDVQWLLFTTEPIETFMQMKQVVRYYELRWRIEEFHKAWKTGGTQVEKQRMQSADNLERMAVILAFIAIRLLQLREAVGNKAQAKAESCTQVLTEVQWRVLWSKQEKKRLPKKVPNLYWAYYAIAKLGGWHDSKRTGRVGWTALWEGWCKLELMVEGVQLARELSLGE